MTYSRFPAVARRRRLVFAVAMITAAVTPAWISNGQTALYWHSFGDDTIYRSNADGSSIEVVVQRRLFTADGIAVHPTTGEVYWGDVDLVVRSQTGVQIDNFVNVDGRIKDVALDAAGGKVYWANFGMGSIQRSNFDGTGIETVVDGIASPRGLALDLTNQKVYWTDDSSNGGVVMRANIDGTNVELLSTAPFSFLGHIELDVAGGKMYYANTTADEIVRANLDGTSTEAVVTGLSVPGGPALDLTAGKLYWLNWQSGSTTGSVHRANLDGSSAEDLGMEVQGPADLTMDPSQSRLLVLEAFSTGRESIQQASLDGSGQSTFVLGVSNIWTHVLDPASGKLFWSHGGGVQRSNLDGTAIEDVVRLVFRPDEMTVAATTNKLYWASSQGIERSNLDGSMFEQIVVANPATTAFAENLVTDEVGGKIYWTGEGFTPDKIHRANLDGSEPEVLFSGLDEPTFLRIDGAAGKLYWFEGVFTTPKIRRANLDGTGAEDLVTDQNASTGFLLNVGEGKMYWSYRMIQRANLDGSNVETLVPSPSRGGPQHLVLDPSEGKMYWTYEGQIERANLDGSQRETVVTGIDSPTGLSVGPAVVTGVEDRPWQEFTGVRVHGAYPNPFASSATIEMDVAQSQTVQIDLYDVLGRRVRVIHNGRLNAGASRRINVDGQALPSGVYFYRISGDRFSQAGSILKAR